MPSLEVDSYGVPAVTAFAEYFEEALGVASSIKPEATVEPVLDESDLEDVLGRLPAAPEPTEPHNTAGLRQRNSSKYATIETAARGLLSNLIVCGASHFLSPKSHQLTSLVRPLYISTPPISSKYGISLTYYNVSPTAVNVTQHS